MKPTAGNASTSPAEFIDSSRTLLGRDYMPKLRRIVDMLSEDDIWWRPNEASNSVGNMLLHMCGNNKGVLGFCAYKDNRGSG